MHFTKLLRLVQVLKRGSSTGSGSVPQRTFPKGGSNLGGLEDLVSIPLEIMSEK